MDYEYSQIVYRKPWLVCPLPDSVIFESEDIIHIPERAKMIDEFLQHENKTEKFYNWCSIEEKEQLAEQGENWEGSMYICFQGADFIASLWTDNWNDDNIFRDSPDLPIVPEQMKFMRGVLYMDMNTNIESHAFVVYIKDNKIKIYNTYGGLTEFYVVDRNLQDWVRKLTHLTIFHDYYYQMNLMSWLFGLPEDYLKSIYKERIIKEMDLSYIRVL